MHSPVNTAKIQKLLYVLIHQKRTTQANYLQIYLILNHNPKKTTRKMKYLTKKHIKEMYFICNIAQMR